MDFSRFHNQGVSWKKLALFDGFCLVALNFSRFGRCRISYQNKADDFSYDWPKFLIFLGTDFDLFQLIKICAILRWEIRAEYHTACVVVFPGQFCNKTILDTYSNIVKINHATYAFESLPLQKNPEKTKISCKTALCQTKLSITKKERLKIITFSFW